MQLRDYDTSHQMHATVQSSTRITPSKSDEEVREIILQVDNPYFHYQVGQTIGVLVPGPHPMGHESHFRLYNLADTPRKTPAPANESSDAKKPLPTITLLVKRCNYIDDYSGEEYRGIASNFLCDLKANEQVTICGPYGIPFEIPEDNNANIVMIGMGTGIAPFRAFVKHIYEEVGGWNGKVRLFYGARTGLEMLYMNAKKDDFANYYDEATFEAFQAVSPRPHWDENIALSQALELQEQELWELLCRHDTYVYVAGLPEIKPMLQEAFSQIAGGEQQWARRQKELIAGGRWTEVIY